MAESREQYLSEITADDVIQAYKDKEINAADRNYILREKAHSDLSKLINNNGYISAILERTVKHANDGWNNIIEAATHTSADQAGEAGMKPTYELYYAGLAMWGQIQILTSIFSAFGEVNGQKAEDLLLHAGANPTVARVTNFAVDVGSGFLPWGTFFKYIGKGAQTLAKASSAGNVGEAVRKVDKAAEEVKQVAAILDEGLKLEGITPKFSVEAAEKSVVPMGDINKALARTQIRTKDVEEAQQLTKLAKEAQVGGEVEQIRFARFAQEVFTNTPPEEKMKYSKEFVHMLSGWNPEAMAKGDIAGAMKGLATDIINLNEKPSALKKFITDSQGGFLALDRNWWGIAREIYQNALLPFAWGGAFIGNSYATGMSVLERATGALFSASDKGLVNKEAFYQVKGMWFAIGDALSWFGKAYGKEGRELLGSTRLDFPDPAIPGQVGVAIRAIGYDTMRGLDNLYQMINVRGVLTARYIREADQAGLTGADIGNYIIRELNGPPTKEAFAEAIGEALQNTFQGQLSAFTRKINSILQTGPGILYFPFMKSYANGIKYAWNRTPLLQMTSAKLYRDLAEGGVAGDLAIGRLTMSMMMGEFYARLAMEGYITGSGPIDPALRRVWQTTHEPYSVKGPGGWIPLTNMEPGSTNVGMIANVVQILDQLDDVTAGQAFMAISFAIMHDMADKTSWQNASNIVDAVQGLHEGREPSGRPLQVLEQPVTTALTLGPLGQRIARGIDPIKREANGFVNNILAKTPYYSQFQPPVRDGYADPIIPPQALGGSWFGLLRPVVPAFKPFETDPIKIEGERVGARLPVFPYHYGGTVSDDFDITAPKVTDRPGVELTAKQRDRWQQIYRNIIRHPDIGIEKVIINNPHYKTDVANGEPTTLAYQQQLFSDYLSDAKADAWDALITEDKKLGMQVLTNDFTHVAPMLNRIRRPMFEGQADEALKKFEQMQPEAIKNLIKYGVLDTPSPSDSPQLPDKSPQQELRPNMEFKLEMQK